MLAFLLIPLAAILAVLIIFVLRAREDGNKPRSLTAEPDFFSDISGDSSAYVDSSLHHTASAHHDSGVLHDPGIHPDVSGHCDVGSTHDASSGLDCGGAHH